MQPTAFKGFRLALQQARLWSLQQQSQAYRAQAMILLAGELDAGAFQQAFQRLVKRHAILRTGFCCLPGLEMPLQVVTEGVEGWCPLISLEGVREACLVAHLTGSLSRALEEPFELEQGPLIRAALVRLSTQRHLWLVSLPALCGDAATLKHLVAELVQQYGAAVQGENLADDPLQYADVSAWQDELLQAEDAEASREYWRKIDLSQLATVHLPFERGEKSIRRDQKQRLNRAFAPHIHEVPVEAKLLAQIEALAERAAVSSAAFLLTCWQVVLWRLTAASPVLVGVACDGRHYEELARALGLYTRVVPFSTSLADDLPFEQLLTQVNTYLEEAVGEQIYFTWETSSSSAGNDQAPGYFPISFEFEDWPSDVTAGRLTVSLMRCSSCMEPFALKLRALQVGQTLHLELHYDPTRLSAEYSQRLADSLYTLLHSAIAQPQAPVGTLPILASTERQRLLHTFSGPEIDILPETLQQLFEEQVEYAPTQVAVVCGSERLTYRQLNRRANQLAHFLRGQGVAPNVLVGLCVERSVQMLVGLLAILKAGGAYVPLDPEQPSIRLAYQLNDVHAPIVLTQKRLVPRLPSWGGQVICLDSPATLWDQELDANPEMLNGPEDLAYVIYTSGSSGMPKGVMIRQRSVVNYTHFLCGLLAKEPGRQFATVSTLAADLGNTAIFCSLASGGCLHVLTYETLTSGQAFANYLRQHPIDVLKIVPSHFSALLASSQGKAILPRRHLVLGGEAFSVALFKKLQMLKAECCVINHYGPTETTVGALVNVLGVLRPGDRQEEAGKYGDEAATLPIGRPIANTQAYILDSCQQLVPVGVTGELYLGGAGLAAGYLHQPEQTQERFVAHPFKSEAAERLYRTGDLVRSTVQGQIEFVGRADTQVKLRGYRIELGEIEAVLGRHGAVWDCAVLLREDEPGEPRLVAYVVARKPPAPTTQELRRLVEDHLPASMVPAAFVRMEALPLTANGKVDRQRLPVPEQSESDMGVSYVAPRSPIEEVLVEIWSEILAVQQVSIHDNFFSLGGHSLLATQVISRIRQVLRVDLPILSLFETATVAALAERVERTLRSEQAVDAAPLVPVSRTQDLPLSFAQQRLWFLDQFEPGRASYSKPMAVQMNGRLNVEALERSLGEIVRRHEVLRTSFRTAEGQPVQAIGPAGTLRLPLVELSELLASQYEAERRRLAAQEAQRPFDLAHGLLLRTILLRLSEDEHIFLLNMHHIVSDAWSNGIFLHELAVLYNAFAAGKSSPLPELPIQYADFAYWQRQWLQGEVLEAQVRYWTQQLSGIASLELPTDRPRPAVQSEHGSHLGLLLPAGLSEELNALSQRAGVTLFMALVAAFQVLLSRYTGQDDISVGIPIANRTRAEIEGLIGFFVNTLVLRTDLLGNPTFLDVLARVREVALGAYAHQDVPFEKLVEVLQPERDLSRSPLFQVAFQLQQAPQPTETLQGLALTGLPGESATSKFDLTLAMIDTKRGLHCIIEYNTDLFDASTITRLLGHWQTLLAGLASHSEQRLADLPLLTLAERQQLLVEWNNAGIDYSKDACIHQLFEGQVLRTADTVAIRDEEHQLTYAELNRRANQLAHQLRVLGVVPGVLVGLCLERSVNLVIGILGILKAGGAYVPLDSTYPMERLAFMLKDAQVSVLVTQQQLLERLPEHEARVVLLDADWKTIVTESIENPTSGVEATSLAYVIYTSGSTGKPKGVLISHSNVVRLFEATRPWYHFDERDVWTLFHSSSFDFSVWELWGALLYGGRLVVVTYVLSRSPDAFYGLLCAEQVTILNQTPSAFRQLMWAEEASGALQKLSLRLVIFGGEALDIQSLKPWFDRHGDQSPQLVNMYGITETTVHVTYRPLIKADMQVALGSSIGGPIADLQAYVLDKHLQLAPVGVPGELFVGGAGLARGYLNRPELTAERFIPNPFNDKPGARLYKTGDLVRFLPDGKLEYLGRLDQQVKVRGYRIELGEVESSLIQHPGIQESMVLVREDEPGDKRLIAYLVPDQQHAFVVRQMLHFTKAGLLNDRTQYELPNGMLIAHRNKSETDFVYQEIFEEQAYLRYGITLHEGDCIFDVGANIGLFTLFMGQKCKHASIYAFEPIPPVFGVLRINTALYGLNVKLFECGLSDEAKYETFTYYPHNTLISGRFADATDREVVKTFLLNQQRLAMSGVTLQSEEVDELLAEQLTSEQFTCQLRTLSDVICEHQVARIDLLKIDAEKSELDVLAGIAESDWQKIRQIVIEVHDIDGRLEMMVALLKKHGFNLAVHKDALLEDTGLYNIYAVRPLEEEESLNQADGEDASTCDPRPMWSSPGLLVNDVRHFLKERLPDYMLPSAFVMLEELPLTPNGKVDRRALPMPDRKRAEKEGTYVAPRNPVEEVLAAIWADILGLERVDIHDNFFELGGHSLLATQLISRIRTLMQVEVPLRNLFETPTVAGLARRIKLQTRGEQDMEAPALVPVSRTQDLPLSFAQQRLWFLDQLEPGSATYLIPVAVRLHGVLHSEALGRSLQEVVRRHESLRTSFHIKAGQPIQVIAPGGEFHLPQVDLRALVPEQRGVEAGRLIQQEAQCPFNLACGPLLRTTLLRMDEDEHVLLLTMHHIVSDGWSMRVLVHELNTLYTAFRVGRASPLPALPIQYADFAAWQRQWLQGAVLDAQLAYWTRQLDGIELLELPTDYLRPAVQTFRGSHQRALLPASLRDSLNRLSLRAGMTLFMTLLAAFQVLLSRYTGQDDIAVGTPIANRTRAEVEGLIGFFVNTLVLRTGLSGNPTFLDLLARVRDVALGAYAHQDVPFEKLVEVLQPERDLSRSPLFQVAFQLEHGSRSNEALPGLTLSNSSYESTSTKFDLTLEVTDIEQGLHCVVEYNADLFGGGTITWLLEHWRTLLESVVAHPEQPLADLPLLSEAELHQLLIDWNDTRSAALPEICLHTLFETQARRIPHAVAVVYEQEYLTYAELNSRAEQVAVLLQSLGVDPGIPVGLCMERSLEEVIALLGLLKAGGVYVPLDPSYPTERLVFLLEETQVSVILTQERLCGRLPEQGTELLCLDSQWERFARLTHSKRESGITPDSLAYIMYTSGSTGRPKGVMVSHRAIGNRLLWGLADISLNEADRVLQVASWSFDIALWECVGPLMAGAQVVLATQEGVKDSSYLVKLMDQQQITVAHFVPSLLQVLLTEPALERCKYLRCILCGGEVLPTELARRLFARLEIPLHQFYGPTEAAISATIWIGEGEYSLPRVPIGRPIANMQIYLLDRYLMPVPCGALGEVYIGGVGLAWGYLHQPAQSAERFIPHPFSREPGARLYQTGDMARYLSTGELEFVGRKDTQVKVRGYRIELGEIEAVLAQCSGVRECVVVAREDNPGDKRLVAYVVSREPSRVLAGEWRQYLQGKLPDYMVPSSFVLLDALPLTSNGKVDRRVLPAPDTDNARSGEDVVVVRTPIEELVVGIWADVLGRKQLGIHDNFFELGGHSLLATQLISRIRTVMQVEMPLRSLFEAPTVAGLALRVEQALRSEQGAGVPSLMPTSREQNLPLSFAQQRVWFLDQLEPGSPFYNIPIALRLCGMLDAAVLERSIQELVRRHESLRTTFCMQEGQPVQVIGLVRAFHMPLVELGGLSPEKRETEARRLTRQEAERPFDLVQGPLLRTTLLQLDEDEHALLLTMHHIVSDGWSIEVLMRELGTLYSAFILGQPSPLPDLPLQYADFAVWQRQWLQGEVLEAQLAYWIQHLDGIEPLELPIDHPRLAVQAFRGTRQGFVLPISLSDNLKRLSQHAGVTLFMTLLAAFQTLLSRYTGQDDIAVGTPIASRTRAEIEGLIGFFVNTLVLRADLSGNPTFLDLLEQVREVTLGAYAHQDVPFEKLVEVLQPERDLSRSPLFQVMFGLQQAPQSRETFSDLTLAALPHEGKTAKFDLTFTMTDAERGLLCGVEYNTDLFEADTITQLLEHWQTLLEGIVAHPGQRLADLPLLTATERQQLLVAWNETAQAFPTDVCIHNLFEGQAQRTPDAIAVVFQDEQLTYSALNQQANQLAHHLQSLAVGPDMLVGLYIQRSIEMIVGVLSILKAGGAYVPLDPAYPVERVAFLLKDAHVKVLLTQQDLLERLPEHEAQVVLLNINRQTIRQAQRENPLSGVRAEHLAYVIYTSGSAGKPKGVLTTHLNVVHSTSARVSYYKETVKSFLLLSSFAFDSSVAGIFWTLSQGARLVLLQPAAQQDVSHLIELIEQQNISHIASVPSLYTLLVTQGRPDQLAALRAIIVAGEVCPAPLVKQHVAILPHCAFFNEYGPTEATVWSSVAECMVDRRQPSIGHPIANTQIYLLDRYLQPVPVGVPGELYIGGSGLARGYMNHLDWTAEHFIANPFSTEPGTRLYKTGDIACYRPNGLIEYLGRHDQQVKVRGHRIELGEIEAVLAQYPALCESVVLVREDTAEDKRLVAYVVANQGAAFAAAELRAYVQRVLPDYMVPSFFVLLEALPLSPNGKVDRRALPAPSAGSARQNDEFLVVHPSLEDFTVPGLAVEAVDVPRTPIEEIVAGVFGDVLGLEQVGIHENFFELGGHSLLVTQLISRIQAQLQVGVPVRNLFEVPTVAGLAEQIERLLRSEQGVQTPPLVPVSREQDLPLSFAQQRLWFLEQLEPGTPTYNSPIAMWLHGTLSAEALERSVQELVRRHENLRTTFRTKGDHPVQVIGPAGVCSFSLVDLNIVAAEQREAEARRLAQQEALRPFDLAIGPLLRTTLLRLGEEKHALLLSMHHSVTDGWSMGVLVRELTALYTAFVQGNPSPLPELPIQYADFACWQRQWLQGEVLEHQLAYWKQQLAGSPPLLKLPTDRPRPLVQTFHGASRPVRIPSALVEGLKNLSRSEGVTLFMLLLGAFQTLLYHYTGQEDIVVGTDVANRNRVEVEGLIGFFVNQLVLRTDLSGNPTFRELLQRVRLMALGAYSHQDLPYEKLVEALKPKRSLQHTPLFQVKITLQNISLEASEPQGLRGNPLAVETTSAKLDLLLSLRETTGGITGGLGYNTALFDDTTMAQMVRHFETLLNTLVMHPDIDLSACDQILAEKGKQTLTIEQEERKEVDRQKLKKIVRRHLDTHT